MIPLPHGQEPAYYGPKCAVLAGLVTTGRAPRAAGKAAGQKQMGLFGAHKQRKPATPRPKKSTGQADWIEDLESEDAQPSNQEVCR